MFRGVKGGYSFARVAETISVLEVVELLDGPGGRRLAACSPSTIPSAKAPPRRTKG